MVYALEMDELRDIKEMLHLGVYFLLMI
uniref:Uncharacterized protein n=1 Tax=Arundo donax TaxID=35708 RepID=A0A0A9AWE2_ARUDO